MHNGNKYIMVLSVSVVEAYNLHLQLIPAIRAQACQFQESLAFGLVCPRSGTEEMSNDIC